MQSNWPAVLHADKQFTPSPHLLKLGRTVFLYRGRPYSHTTLLLVKPRLKVLPSRACQSHPKSHLYIPKAYPRIYLRRSGVKSCFHHHNHVTLVIRWLEPCVVGSGMNEGCRVKPHAFTSRIRWVWDSCGTFSSEDGLAAEEVAMRRRSARVAVNDLSSPCSS